MKILNPDKQRCRITRASHVEPSEDNLWYADMKPLNGPILGPFETRQEALDAEAYWIEQHIL